MQSSPGLRSQCAISGWPCWSITIPLSNQQKSQPKISKAIEGMSSSMDQWDILGFVDSSQITNTHFFLKYPRPSHQEGLCRSILKNVKWQKLTVEVNRKSVTVPNMCKSNIILDNTGPRRISQKTRDYRVKIKMQFTKTKPCLEGTCTTNCLS
jgi:hypothetical protein